MKNPENKLIRLWKKYPPSEVSSDDERIDREKLDQTLLHFFCPGPSFFGIFDFSKLDFDYIHEDVNKVLGLSPEEAKLSDQYALILPSELEFIQACEEYAGKFLFQLYPAQLRKQYKVNYAYRSRTTDGDIKLIFHQAITIRIDKNDHIAKTLVVNSDVTHLFQELPKTLSLVGLGDLPSYFNIEVMTEREPGQIVSSKNPLTRRQTQVLRLLAEGYTDREIAGMLYLAEDTIRTHRNAIRAKLGSKNTTMAVAMAIRNGWI